MSLPWALRTEQSWLNLNLPFQPRLDLPGWVTLGKFLNLSVPQFSSPMKKTWLPWGPEGPSGSCWVDPC